MYPYTKLIVGVADQAETEKFKGKTLMNGYERTESVKHCKWADEVVYPCPWVTTPEFIDKYNIDYVAHDDAPYGGKDAEDIYGWLKKIGKFAPTTRTDGISTSDLIMRIIKDRD